MRSVLVMLFAAAAFPHAAKADEQTTAALDVARYLGTWYELARFPSYFEKGCAGVTATYARRDDGRLSVVNTCHKGAPDGKASAVTGKAWVPDPAAPGKLKVQFFWPFRGDYWVLEVGPAYEWALIGGPGRKQCWILSRTPIADEATWKDLLGRLARRGYDTNRLERVVQR